MAGRWELVPAACKGTARNVASETAGWAHALLQICSHTHIFQRQQLGGPTMAQTWAKRGRGRPGWKHINSFYREELWAPLWTAPSPCRDASENGAFRNLHISPKPCQNWWQGDTFFMLLNQQSTAWNLAGWQTLADRHSRRRAGHSKSIF